MRLFKFLAGSVHAINTAESSWTSIWRTTRSGFADTWEPLVQWPAAKPQRTEPPPHAHSREDAAAESWMTARSDARGEAFE